MALVATIVFVYSSGKTNPAKGVVYCPFQLTIVMVWTLCVFVRQVDP